MKKRIQGKVERIWRRFSVGGSGSVASVSSAVVPQPAREKIFGDPKLPPELERAIFELAAQTDFPTWWARQNVGDTMLVLPRVCRRAQAWIEPLIYERIAILQTYNGIETLPLFLATVDARPAGFFATHVKVLYLDRMVPLPAARRILCVCTSVEIMGCYHPYSAIAPLLAYLPLARLFVSELSLPTAAALPPWAVTLTHLGLSNAIPLDPIATFHALPALTHLAVGYDALPDPSEGPGMGGALAQLTAAVSRLRVLVLATGAKTEYRWARQRIREEGFADARLYVHLGQVGDAPWDAWSRRVPDMFEDAEESFSRRRQER